MITNNSPSAEVRAVVSNQDDRPCRLDCGVLRSYSGVVERSSLGLYRGGLPSLCFYPGAELPSLYPPRVPRGGFGSQASRRGTPYTRRADQHPNNTRNDWHWSSRTASAAITWEKGYTNVLCRLRTNHVASTFPDSPCTGASCVAGGFAVVPRRRDGRGNSSRVSASHPCPRPSARSSSAARLGAWGSWESKVLLRPPYSSV